MTSIHLAIQNHRPKSPNYAEISRHVALAMHAARGKEFLPTSDRIARIEEVVCEHFKASIDVISNKSRKPDIVRPRQVLIYLLRNCNTGLSIKAIGRRYGFHHTSVIYAVEMVENDMWANEEIKNEIEKLKCKI